MQQVVHTHQQTTGVTLDVVPKYELDGQMAKFVQGPGG